jgi:hypothetical protein
MLYLFASVLKLINMLGDRSYLFELWGKVKYVRGMNNRLIQKEDLV